MFSYAHHIGQDDDYEMYYNFFKWIIIFQFYFNFSCGIMMLKYLKDQTL